MNIQEMAKQAGFEQVMRHKDGSSTVLPTTMFERFAALVLEEAAKACDYRHHDWRWDDEPDSPSGPRECAAAIRALKGAKE